MSPSKKTFKDNPALAFISTPNAQNTAGADNTAGTAAAQPQELKSRRMNLTLQPSVVEGITKIAFLNRTSANDMINTALKEYIQAHSDQIKKYDTIFSKE